MSVFVVLGKCLIGRVPLQVAAFVVLLPPGCLVGLVVQTCPQMSPPGSRLLRGVEVVESPQGLLGFWFASIWLLGILRVGGLSLNLLVYSWCVVLVCSLRVFGFGFLGWVWLGVISWGWGWVLKLRFS